MGKAATYQRGTTPPENDAQAASAAGDSSTCSLSLHLFNIQRIVRRSATSAALANCNLYLYRSIADTVAYRTWCVVAVPRAREGARTIDCSVPGRARARDARAARARSSAGAGPALYTYRVHEYMYAQVVGVLVLFF